DGTPAAARGGDPAPPVLRLDPRACEGEPESSAAGLTGPRGIRPEEAVERAAVQIAREPRAAGGALAHHVGTVAVCTPVRGPAPVARHVFEHRVERDLER